MNKTRVQKLFPKRALLTSAFHVFYIAFCVSSLHADDWRLALPGWQYEFPRDHAAHPDFKTEWWYFTGNLRDEKSGNEFGYQLTWFRHGIRREHDSALSRFVVRDLDFAHFTLSDLHGGEFYFSQKISRGAFGEAGSSKSDALPGRVAWIDDWQLFLKPDGAWEITGADENRAVKLRLAPIKPPVIHGENGVSQKAEGTGHASCYYSLTRLATTGEISLNGKTYQVSGESWFDHEWATNQLTPGQIGWNWFSLQFDDGTELMLYQMRRRDGGIDPNSSGTLISQNGTTMHLTRNAYELTPLDWWKSSRTGARYPVRWHLRIPQSGLDLDISTPLEKQELALESLSYWEGAIRATGTREGRPLSGHGYMELTGYQEALSGLGGRAGQ
jgi:predicted secreted hydrolase